MLKVIYEDIDILVVEKPVGIESQSSRRFEPDMVSEIKKHLSTNISTKPSTRGVEPYVGVIHRLDKPVSGVMVYAKNQKAAGTLSKQVQSGQMKKVYHAVSCGKLVDNVGNYVDYLLKDGKNNFSRIVDKNQTDSKKAELNYRVLNVREEAEAISLVEAEAISLVEVELLTGRHHQIRVQLAGHGNPLWGDSKYNPEWRGTLPGSSGSSVCAARRTGSLALSAVRLQFVHPTSGKTMEFTAVPQGDVFTHFDVQIRRAQENIQEKQHEP